MVTRTVSRTLTALTLGALAAAVASSCSLKTDNPNAPFACGSGDTCPSGLACRDQFCLPPLDAGSGSNPTDAGGSNTPAACAGAIASGGEHSCVLETDGSVWCWGRNDLGQLGDGTTTDRGGPVQVTGLGGATAIGAGRNHTCAVTGSGTWCWGADDANQLGDGGSGSGTHSAVPVQAQGLDSAKAIAGGDKFTCALRIDGSVWCWGDNSGGQLGDTTTTAHGPGSADVSGVVLIAAHSGTACAALGDTSVRCWGSNDTGQLANGGTASAPTPVPITGVISPSALAVGQHHVCAVLADGRVKCWGDSSVGQVGIGFGPPQQVVPPTLAAMSVAAKSIVAGDTDTCAIDTTNRMWCWGENADNRFGDGQTGELRFAPTLTGIIDIAEIAAGSHHTCVRDATGGVRCFGSDLRGQLGDNQKTSNPTPRPVPGLSANVAGITAGGQHTCAWLTDGTAKCWGANTDGEVGDGATQDRSSPTTVNLTHITAVAAGINHTCAMVGSGSGSNTLACWGANNFGQLGDNSNASSPDPVAINVNSTNGVLQIAPGGDHTCVRLVGGEARCWGQNNVGQLGDTNTTNETTAFTVNGNNFLNIGAGFDFNCGMQGGSMFCWGFGGDGALGANGNTQNQASPVFLFNGSTSPLTPVATGRESMCTIGVKNGLPAAFCQGTNFDGAQGDGLNEGQNNSPELVAAFGSGSGSGSGSAVVPVAVFAGGFTACAELSDNSLWCWGEGDSGQFPDYANRPVPTKVMDVPVASYQVAIGDDQICMLVSGAVTCWGGDARGELGDGVEHPVAPRTVALTCPAAP